MSVSSTQGVGRAQCAAGIVLALLANYLLTNAGRIDIIDGQVRYEVAANWLERGVSKLSGRRDAWRHVRFMLIYSPSYLLQLPGMVLLVVGTALVMMLAGGPREILGHRWDYRPMCVTADATALPFKMEIVRFVLCSGVMEHLRTIARRPARWGASSLGTAAP